MVMMLLPTYAQKRDRLEKDVSYTRAQLVDVTAQLKHKDQELSDFKESIEIKKAKIEEMESSIDGMDLLQDQLHKQQNKVHTATSCYVGCMLSF